ncbi:hypothetical protein DIPPA_59404 [Diplonema papillatum]|nr:hypothetical protein DIPPA_59404 [Diplonema papillatum]
MSSEGVLLDLLAELPDVYESKQSRRRPVGKFWNATDISNLMHTDNNAKLLESGHKYGSLHNDTQRLVNAMMNEGNCAFAIRGACEPFPSHAAASPGCPPGSPALSSFTRADSMQKSSSQLPTSELLSLPDLLDSDTVNDPDVAHPQSETFVESVDLRLDYKQRGCALDTGFPCTPEPSFRCRPDESIPDNVGSSTRNAVEHTANKDTKTDCMRLVLPANKGSAISLEQIEREPEIDSFNQLTGGKSHHHHYHECCCSASFDGSWLASRTETEEHHHHYRNCCCGKHSAKARLQHSTRKKIKSTIEQSSSRRRKTVTVSDKPSASLPRENTMSLATQTSFAISSVTENIFGDSCSALEADCGLNKESILSIQSRIRESFRSHVSAVTGTPSPGRRSSVLMQSSPIWDSVAISNTSESTLDESSAQPHVFQASAADSFDSTSGFRGLVKKVTTESYCSYDSHPSSGVIKGEQSSGNEAAHASTPAGHSGASKDQPKPCRRPTKEDMETLLLNVARNAGRNEQLAGIAAEFLIRHH